MDPIDSTAHRTNGDLRPANGHGGPAWPDAVMWGIDIAEGLDELYDPWLSRGQKGHAYLNGNDTVALCGRRPGKRMFLASRPVKLGLPSAGVHPVCRKCARRIAAMSRRVAVPATPAAPRVGVPIQVSSAYVDTRLTR